MQNGCDRHPPKTEIPAQSSSREEAVYNVSDGGGAGGEVVATSPDPFPEFQTKLRLSFHIPTQVSADFQNNEKCIARVATWGNDIYFCDGVFDSARTNAELTQRLHASISVV